MRPFSEACDENKEPILAVLHPLLGNCSRVLEIGSGTGQHACHFAANLPHLTWVTSDLPANHAGITAWLTEEGSGNIEGPLELDVTRRPWPPTEADAIFSANTSHIMCWEGVEAMFSGVAYQLLPGGLFILYGPFNYNGSHTSESNRRFDHWLKTRDPRSGIRDFEALDTLARHHNMVLVDDIEMPVNNRTLVWRKI